MSDDARERDEAREDEALEELKEDVAEEENVPLEEDADNGDLTARQLGKVGGNMVRRLIERGKQALAGDDDEMDSEE